MKQITVFLLLIASFQIYGQNDFLTYEKALQRSKEEGKPIMLVFSGSDWCKPCIALKKTILETSDFQKIKEKVIFMYLDFPYKRSNRLSKEETKHNEGLADRYNRSGEFPKSILLDSSGKIIQEVRFEYGMSPDEYINQIQKEI